MKQKNQRTLAIFSLALAIVSTTIAYAALSTTLNISGTVTKKGGSWNIYFTNPSSASIEGSAKASTITLASTQVSFNVELYKPNDSVTYTVDIKNGGTIDAILDSVTLTGVDTASNNDITYKVTYKDGTTIKKGDTLNKGVTKTIKIYVKYNDVSTVSSTDIKLNLGASLAYIQTTDSGSTGGGGSTTNVLCKAVTTSTTGNVPTGNYAYGDEYTCELGDNEEKTFFVLETNGDNVSLIMDRNIDSNGKGTTSGNTVAWVSKEDYIAAGGTESDYGAYGNNNLGPITVQKYLRSSTASWTKLTSSQISLPTYDQIKAANGGNGRSLPSWLYGNLNSSSNPSSYWTSTPNTFSSGSAYTVSYSTRDLIQLDVGYFHTTGVRPVITISKSNIS